MPGIGDKLMTASEIKEVTDTKLDKDFSSLDTSGGFSLSDTIPVNISGTTYKITGQTLSNAIGGGGGTQQASLTNYVKNCDTISVLPVTLTDSNITSDMIVIEYTIGDETALGSDWTVTTADGSLTISGTLNKSTTLQLVLSVGYSTTPSILTNLASDTADNVLKASPRPGVTGVLPLTHGGVGSSTASGARTNLSVYSKAETDSAIAESTAYGNTLADGTDLDSLKANKIHYLAIGRTYAHHPASGTPTTLLVFSQSLSTLAFCVQIAITSNQIFIRYQGTSSGSVWNPWYCIQKTGNGWQTSGTDLDDLIYSGTYGLSGNSSYSHMPTGVTGGILTVVNPGISGAYCMQRLEVGSTMYIRYRSASSGTAFGSWYKYTGTVVN